MSATIRVHADTAVLEHTDGIRAAYLEAFCAPPWNEPPDHADAYVSDSLTFQVKLPGFTAAVALHEDTGEVLGFVTGWTTPTPFPTERSYPQVAAGLGPDRTQALLCGSFEIDELAVRPQAQGSGLAARLLAAVTAHRTDGRCWLLTSQQAPHAVDFYRKAGWIQATAPSADGKGIVVFLGPQYPDRDQAATPQATA
ncbi:GNAT family N-acetyltransferase [Yinghuangia soli]|uniref:GNAT family N-acetyltransferase n=1 Tax=Yinghuangia soli TaxID=2908204 RepID=A0AA41Q8A7_9ACTN|nr:GNAT family N-acetyltransferase [Yinghuangia soli]MCF2533464.1 GNAT family N-acetyltransferase [Yinghuangia soli]